MFLPHFLSHMGEEQEKLWESLRVHPFGAGMSSTGSGKVSNPVSSGWVEGSPSLLQLCTSSGTQKFPSEPSSKSYSAKSAAYHQMD